MKINEGTVDRVIRVVAGFLLLAVGLLNVVGVVVMPLWLALVLDAVGAILLVTGIVGFCPLYTLFRLNTGKKA